MNRFGEQRHGTVWLGCVVLLWGLLIGLTLLLTGSQTSRADPGIIYVDADATGAATGESWADAYTDLQHALSVAGVGDEIWVAAGTYKPTVPRGGSGWRYRSFQMKNGVALYGGFEPSAGATGFEDRDWDVYVTILSGDIGVGEGYASGDSYHVFYHPEGTDLDRTAILDGFTVTGGNADGDYVREMRGGGMSNSGSSPTLTNVVFSGNEATFGGGMCNSYQSSPTLTNVSFSGNRATSGGGMHNYSSSPTLTNVTFILNQADRGGGMVNHTESKPVLTEVAFTGNRADGDGGGMCNWYRSSPTLTNVSFSGNTATDDGGGMDNFERSSPRLTNVVLSGNEADDHGGGMHNYANSNPTLSNVTFSGNQAGSNGGGMYNDESSPTLSDVTFSGNRAAEKGGGMCNQRDSSPTLTDVTFWDNQAEAGGGMYNLSSSPTLTRTSFIGNQATSSGGGMHNRDSNPGLMGVNFWDNQNPWYGGGMANYEGSSPTVTKVYFISNRASISGGGMYNYDSSPTLTNVALSGNRGSLSGGGMTNLQSSSPWLTNVALSGNQADMGGGMYNSHSNPVLTNVTFSGNQADDHGGGMSNSDSSPTVVNSILWGNGAAAGPQIHNSGTSAPGVTYSDIEGGYSGEGNMDADPLFVEPVPASEAPATGGDYHLSEGSPAVDRGSNEAVPEDVDGDLDGNPRIVDGTGDGNAVVDMGAYEYLEALLTILKQGQGLVTGTPGSIDCGGVCTAGFLAGTEVSLTATAETGWTFDGWSGDVESTENPLAITIQDDTVITATFRDEYTLDVNIVGEGDVEVDPRQDTYGYGEEVTLAATPNTGWSFVGWSGGVESTENPLELTIEGDTAITATFVEETKVYLPLVLRNH